MNNKLTFYDKYLISTAYPSLYQEAGVKENMMYAVLSLALTGFDFATIGYIANKTGISKARLEEVYHDKQEDQTMYELEELLKKRNEDARIREFYQNAAELAREAVNSNDKDKMALESVTSTECEITDEVVRAIIAVEGAASGYVGEAGDTGIMQITPSAWEDVNKRYFGGKGYSHAKYAKNKKINRKYGGLYLNLLKERIYSSNRVVEKMKKGQLSRDDLMTLVFAAYNGGEGRIKECDFDINRLKERYPKIHDYATRAKNLVDASTPQSQLPPPKGGGLHSDV